MVYFKLGKYHDLKNGTPPTIVTENTFDFNGWIMGDTYNSTDYALDAFEPLSNSRAEVVAQLITGITVGGTVNWKWYRNSDNKLIADITRSVPTPSSGEAWAACWIGKFPHEIDRPGLYHVDITNPWLSYVVTYTFTMSGIADEGFADFFDVTVLPSSPKSGDTVTVTPIIINTGYPDSIGCYIGLVGGADIYANCKEPTSDGKACRTVPRDGEWRPSASFVLGSSSVTVAVDTYHGGSDLLNGDYDKHVTRVITVGDPPCTGVNISRDKATCVVGDTVKFTLTRLPYKAGYTATLMRQTGSGSWVSAGTCLNTPNAYCTIPWVATAGDVGSVTFRGEYPGCQSEITTVIVTGGGANDVVVTGISSNANPVDVNGAVTFTADLKNDGDISTHESIIFSIDGKDVRTNSLTLLPHSTRTTTTAFPASYAELGVGTHNVCARSNTGAVDKKCLNQTVTGTCSPPGGVERKCESDGKTLSVWNAVTCKYDSQICSTGKCENGSCVAAADKYTCADMCFAPHTEGDYNSQQACLTACTIIPGVDIPWIYIIAGVVLLLIIFLIT